MSMAFFSVAAVIIVPIAMLIGLVLLDNIARELKAIRVELQKRDDSTPQ